MVAAEVAHLSLHAQAERRDPRRDEVEVEDTLVAEVLGGAVDATAVGDENATATAPEAAKAKRSTEASAGQLPQVARN